MQTLITQNPPPHTHAARFHYCLNTHSHLHAHARTHLGHIGHALEHVELAPLDKLTVVGVGAVGVFVLGSARGRLEGLGKSSEHEVCACTCADRGDMHVCIYRDKAGRTSGNDYMGGY